MVLELGSARRDEGMLCPHCRVTLAMTTRANVEIDYCPKCRGIWLDRGELDKIVERAAADIAPQAPAQAAPVVRELRRDSRDRRDDDDRDDDWDDDRYKKRSKKRRKSWLEEIFDELT